MPALRDAGNRRCGSGDGGVNCWLLLGAGGNTMVDTVKGQHQIAMCHDNQLKSVRLLQLLTTHIQARRESGSEPR